MTVDGSQFTPIIVNTLNPLMYRSGTEEKPVQKIGLDYKAPLKKRSAGGPASCGASACATPLIKRASCPVFICTPAAISYINLIYIPPSLSRIPPAHISLSRTPARRASEKPCTAITHNFLATFTHRGAINLSGYLRYQLFVPSRLRCVPGMFSDEDAHV